jgi:hypothetical protein
MRNTTGAHRVLLTTREQRPMLEELDLVAAMLEDGDGHQKQALPKSAKLILVKECQDLEMRLFWLEEIDLSLRSSG